MLTSTRTAVSVGMAPAGSKISLDPATFMLSNKRFIGCTEGDSVPHEVGVQQTSTSSDFAKKVNHSFLADLYSSSYQN
jgi:Zn-dependent alcohol dehydrogenase